MMRHKLGLVVFVVLLAAFPAVLPEFYVTLLNYIGLSALVTLGVVLLTGGGGLTSFGQAAFVGVGAYSTAFLTTATDVPAWMLPVVGSPWLGLLAGLLVTGAVALLLGLLTLRLSGHYLPLGTIAWGISLYFLFGNLEFLGGFTGITGIPVLSIFGLELRSGREFYYLIWVVVLAAIRLTENLLDSREGRAIRALQGGSLMAESMGVNTGRAKIVIFVIAALFACVSGWLYAHLQRFVNPTPFGLQIGIEYLFMAVIGGAAHVWGALVGAGLITILKQWLQDLLPHLLGSSGNYEVIVLGVLLVLVLQHARDGLWPVLIRLTERRRQPSFGKQVDALPRRSRPLLGTVLLDARSVCKTFGGLTAIDGMSMTVRVGEIVALIGPNGAGKSTMFNVVSGVLPVTGGEIYFNGERVDALAARLIARRGMSRSFQHVRLLAGMSVLENVAIGAHGRGRAGVLAACLHLERAEDRRLLGLAASQVKRVGLGDFMFAPAGSLALGQQRILEIARALCSDPCLLLLDEPAAGLRYLEKQALADLLRRLRGEGMGILVVEHDMEFVMGLVDRCVVMEFGRKIAEGVPDEVQSNPVVLGAYLGDAL
jgi:branched-chain amino acid transport system permease protein